MDTKLTGPLLLASFGILITLSARAADDSALQNPAFKGFYSELKTLFRKHYPQSTSHLFKDSVHFESDTRVLVVHEETMNGDWQDPWETRGPKPGGILGEIRFMKGNYQEHAAGPQTFDKRYFKILLLAPYSKKHDAHIVVRLSYPRNVQEDFLKEFTKLVNELEIMWIEQSINTP